MKLLRIILKCLSKVIIVSLIRKKSLVTGNQSRKLFDYEECSGQTRQPYYNTDFVKKFLKDKPKGLNVTAFDLEFPEYHIYETQHVKREPRYRTIQCSLVGDVNYLQKKIYKNVAFVIKGFQEFSDFHSSNCKNDVKVTLSPPANFGTKRFFTDHFKLYERSFSLSKKAATVVEFEDVLNEGYIEMELFWINFEFSGRCHKYVTVELIKPFNSDFYGDLKSNDEARAEAMGPKGEAPKQ